MENERVASPNAKPILSLAVPFYNESDGVSLFFEHVIPILEGITAEFEIVCINDGSTDNTLDLLITQSNIDHRVKVYNLSRNFGKEAALCAALDHSTGHAVIPIDSDLQDPPELIPEMYQKWRDGYEVVLAKRKSRESDSLGKNLSANSFYQIFNILSEIKIPNNVGDFRLMDRKVLESLSLLEERNRFMKGLFAWVGYDTYVIEFDREKRSTGETKWKKWKLINLALDGIFAFSAIPLKIWTYFGLFVSGISLLYGIFLISRTLVLGIDVPGYASTLVIMLFLGGIQLIGLGILGEYIARLYNEVKRRPLYIVRK